MTYRLTDLEEDFCCLYGFFRLCGVRKQNNKSIADGYGIPLRRVQAYQKIIINAELKKTSKQPLTSEDYKGMCQNKSTCMPKEFPLLFTEADPFSPPRINSDPPLSLTDSEKD